MDILPFVDLSRQNMNNDASPNAGGRLWNGKSRVLVIASSTGGTNALEIILRDLPDGFIPTVIVQHMSSGFTGMLADRLNRVSAMEVKEASEGDILRPGLALLAPEDSHMRLRAEGGNLVVECFTGEKIHGLMPAADVLFESVARLVKDKAIGVVLTGMGADGAEGLLKMRLQGAKTIGQDKESSVVYGMPKKAFEIGAVEYVAPLNRIAEKIISLACV